MQLKGTKGGINRYEGGVFEVERGERWHAIEPTLRTAVPKAYWLLQETLGLTQPFGRASEKLAGQHASALWCCTRECMRGCTSFGGSIILYKAGSMYWLSCVPPPALCCHQQQTPWCIQG